ncbi:hypothetical protein HPP92_020523 [Vanilla planifolia]|uniref:BUB1 N-terminal domain-containing protein n=1 Tax=Vanilla planifolia TaxID=51239 RepID=A0A835UIK3_VANPL|nr:hypothetical protein HPP92_020523 [Vanilla planifolia]
MEETTVAEFDPEADFIHSKRARGKNGSFTNENVRPLKRGRKVEHLNHVLQSHAEIASRKSLLEARRKMIEGSISTLGGSSSALDRLEMLTYPSCICIHYGHRHLSRLRGRFHVFANTLGVWPKHEDCVERTHLCASTESLGGQPLLASSLFAAPFFHWLKLMVCFHRMSANPSTSASCLGSWCIKWVQESFPSGGDSSGLVIIYEQCVRTFWNDKRYKDDKRYLKVWLEYAENCVDAEVIYKFLQVNQIGQSYSAFYVAYALHMQSKNKLQIADELFNLGIARSAEPLQVLETAYRKFLGRSMVAKKIYQDDAMDNHLPARSFGTILASRGDGRQSAENSGANKKNRKPFDRLDSNKSLSIYTDEISGSSYQSLKPDENDSWNTLGSRSVRNKENISVPMKWVSHKVPQKISHRIETVTAARIEVFVDDECADNSSKVLKVEKGDIPIAFRLNKADAIGLKKETELLKENPLRNFPLKAFR